MSHRIAIVLSIAATLFLAAGVYAGRDRLMTSDGNLASSAAADSTATGLTQQTSAVPPLSPSERAVWPAAAETSRIASDAVYSGDDDDDWDDEEWRDDDDDDHDDEDHDDDHDEDEDEHDDD